MSVGAHLYYFNGRGRAEFTRLLLTVGGIKFEETDLNTKEEFLELKPTLLFGQLPLLKLDGESFVQSGAIARALARKFDLYGKTTADQNKVDCYFEGTRDFYTPFIPIGFTTRFDEVVEKSKPTIEKYLPIYDKLLLGGGEQDYLVGGSLTIADLGLLEVLLAIIDYHGKEVFEKYKGIEKFLAKISTEKFYQFYVKEIRKPKNTQEYVDGVKKVLF